jgi:uncharacterized protein YfcZ (UPF0381/DUF406 family)
MRVGSTMKLVLENTDNAAHYAEATAATAAAQQAVAKRQKGAAAKASRPADLLH